MLCPAPSGTQVWLRRRFVVLVLAIVAWSSATIIAQQGLIPGVNVNVVRGTDPIEGDPFLQRQNEPSMAVSSRNPCHLLAGSNDYRTVDIPDPTPLPNDGKDTTLTLAAQAPDAWLGVYQSVDCGTTWRSTLLPGFPQDVSPEGLASPNKGYGAGADPVVRAGTNGMFFFAGLVFDRQNLARSQIFLSRYVDDNNRERGDTIRYLDTSAISSATDGFFE
jgi:hypothetical protein